MIIPQARANSIPYPFTGHTRSNPAAGAEIIAYFLQNMDLMIKQAVKEALEQTQLSQHSPANLPTMGSIELPMEITGLSKARIYALVSERGIPHSKRGNRLFFNRAELLAWVAEGSRAERKKLGR